MCQTAEWRVAGIVAEGQPINLDGINPWDLEWQLVREAAVTLQHPQYNELHQFSVYQVESGSKLVKFAAGELSANVWGFYLSSSPAR